jgi:hypothetical protein
MRRIGRGRLGEIYEAHDAVSRDVGVERHVALQRIDDRIVAEQRFIDELESGYAMLRAGTHPNVVKTIDFFRDGKGYFLVMELLEGLSLKSVLDDAAPHGLSFEETASIVRAAGDGLQYLHAKSIVHGDLRPANVFITFDYVVKLLDVTPISPLPGVPYRVEDAEQATRSRDVRDDVYDLACLTYELLSGRHPFNANSPHDAERAGLTVAPLHDLTVRQWQAIARGLALRRSERTPSVAQFLSELGISGSERLRSRDRSDDDDARSPAELTPLRSVPAAPSEALDVDETIGAPRDVRALAAERARRRPRPRRKTGSHPRMWLLLVALVGIGGFTYLNYDELRARATDLIAKVDAAIAPPPSMPAAPAPGAPDGAGEPGAAAAAVGAAADGAGGAVAATNSGPEAAVPSPSEAGERNADTAVSGAPSAGEPAAPAASLPNASTPDAAASGAAAPHTRGASISPPNAGAGSAASAPPTASEPAPAARETRETAPAARSSAAAAAPSGPAFRFAQAVVTVRESQAAAPIVIERSAASAPATIVWWTSDNTAVADEDYADLGQRTERFAAGEQSRTVYVPLVVDALPERTESFFVYIGRHDPARGRLEPLSSVRVDVRDDD